MKNEKFKSILKEQGLPEVVLGRYNIEIIDVIYSMGVVSVTYKKEGSSAVEWALVDFENDVEIGLKFYVELYAYYPISLNGDSFVFMRRV